MVCIQLGIKVKKALAVISHGSSPPVEVAIYILKQSNLYIVVIID